MRPLNLDLVTIDYWVPLDEEGALDWYGTGEYGYTVYCTVPLDELVDSGLFKEISFDCVYGELEFTVDENGILVGDVFLSTVEEIYYRDNEEGERPDFYKDEKNLGYLETETIYYDENIDKLVDEFNSYPDEEDTK